MEATKAGDYVQIHYTGRFRDGSVFDSSDGQDPLAFTAGGDEVIPGVSQAVIGMRPGEKKTVEVPPEQGYGLRDPAMEQRIARDKLPPEVQIGDPLQAQSEAGSFVVWVKELNDEEAVLDANHPLAGRVLIFDIELVAIGSAAG